MADSSHHNNEQHWCPKTVRERGTLLTNVALARGERQQQAVVINTRPMVRAPRA